MNENALWDPYDVVARLKADPDVALMGFRLHASVSDATLNAYTDDDRDGRTNVVTAYPKGARHVDIYDRRESRAQERRGSDGSTYTGSTIHERVPAEEAERIIRRILLQTVPEGQPHGADVAGAVERALPVDTAAWLRAHKDQLLDTFDDVAGAIFRVKARKEHAASRWTPEQIVKAAEKQAKRPVMDAHSALNLAAESERAKGPRGRAIGDLARAAYSVQDPHGIVFGSMSSNGKARQWEHVPGHVLSREGLNAFARHYHSDPAGLRDFWLAWITQEIDPLAPSDRLRTGESYRAAAYEAVDNAGRRFLDEERTAAAERASRASAEIVERIRRARALLVFPEPLPWAKAFSALPPSDVWFDVGFPLERWTGSLVMRDVAFAMRREPGPDVADVYFEKAPKVKATGGDLRKLPDEPHRGALTGRLPAGEAAGFLAPAVNLYESLVQGVRLRGEVFAWSAHFCAPLSKLMQRRVATWSYIDDVKKLPGKLREHFFAAGYPQILVSTDGNQMLLAGVSESDTGGTLRQDLRIVGATAENPEALYPKGRRGDPTAYGRVIPTVASGGRLLPHHEVLASTMGSASPSLAMQAIDTLGDYPEWPLVVPEASVRGEFRELDVEAVLRSLREVSPEAWGTEVWGYAPEWVKTRKVWTTGYRTPRVAFQSDGSVRFVPADGEYAYDPSDKQGENLTESALARRAVRTLTHIAPGTRTVFQAGLFLDAMALLAANGSYRCQVSVPTVDSKPVIVQNIGGRRPVMLLMMGLVLGTDK